MSKNNKTERKVIKKKTSQGSSPRTKVGRKGSKLYKKKYRGQGKG